MLLLILYVSIALGFSFLCSIAEAVILSISSAYVSLLEQEGKPVGKVLKHLKADINTTLAAILTLNTIAHTVGAAGAGAQAAIVFGDGYLGVISAVLTLLILIFSEIIPKTLGATYWRQLAPVTAYGLKFLVWVLYPFVKLSNLLTRGLSSKHEMTGFSRQEFAAMADLGHEEGQLVERESKILKNVLRLQEIVVTDVMTPRSVVFSVPENMSVKEFFERHKDERFSRVVLYSPNNREHVTGFILRSDVLLAKAKGDDAVLVKEFSRELGALKDTDLVKTAFDEMLKSRSHILVILDEYGGMQGIVTLEDILETLLGLEIIDESDTAVDMQDLARSLWRARAKKMGLPLEGSDSK